jgi:hypothetical protein
VAASSELVRAQETFPDCPRSQTTVCANLAVYEDALLGYFCVVVAQLRVAS